MFLRALIPLCLCVNASVASAEGARFGFGWGNTNAECAAIFDLLEYEDGTTRMATPADVTFPEIADAFKGRAISVFGR